MTFYMILIFHFDLIFGVIGYQNYFKDRFNGMKDYQVTLKHENENEYPGVEYRDIGHFFGNAFSVWRMSMGDNALEAVVYMNPGRTYLFWIVWCIICYLTFIIFFNFIIAEASESYNRVNENLD